MHWLYYSLLVTTLGAAYWQSSVVQAESSNATKEPTLDVDPKEDEVLLNPIVPESTFTGLDEKAENLTEQSNPVTINITTTANLKSDDKRDVENATINDIKPFLLFPILPYLFPPREEENVNSGKDEFFNPSNDTAKIEGNSAEVKPFIFFDFAFNIRQIPINNITDNANDSKIINIKKLSVSKEDDPKLDALKNRRRRNTKIETPSFFDDSPLFPDSELDEFLPKPDLFFPDLPFHHKPVKKLSRRKRDQKKTELKNDLKSFFDAFDEAFMRAKRELEWTDPILNFLRGGDQSFDEDKKVADDLFSQLPEIQEKPSVKWRIQRNIKRLNNDPQIGLTKTRDSPTIIVDKVVKIGEFHVHDDGRDKNMKKKRGLIDSKRKFLGHDSHDELTAKKEDQDLPKGIFELIKLEGTKRKKRVHPKFSNSEEEESKKAESREIRSPPQMNTSSFSTKNQVAQPNVKESSNDLNSIKVNSTEKLENLMKVFDSLRGQIEQELKKDIKVSGKKQSVGQTPTKSTETKGRDDLKKNLTELLKQFLALNQNLADSKLMEKPEVGERDDSKLFDWAEKETLPNPSVLGKDSRDRRQKKDAYFEDEFVNPGDKERKVADLFKTLKHVTIPSIAVLSVILIICFVCLQVKGRFCTKLFKPRQVLILNDDVIAQLKSQGTKRVQPI